MHFSNGHFVGNFSKCLSSLAEYDGAWVRIMFATVSKRGQFQSLHDASVHLTVSVSY